MQMGERFILTISQRAFTYQVSPPHITTPFTSNNGTSFAGAAFVDGGVASIPGDVNCDGVVDLLDVEPFVDLILNGGFNAKADLNGDGVVDLVDVAPFVALLLG